MAESLLGVAKRYRMWSVLVVGAVVFVDIFHRFCPRAAIYGAFDDDFFYYAQVARHLAQGAGSTFDGIHRTNGYHPLWLLCLTLFSLIDSGRLFFPLVTAATVLSLGSIFLLGVRILKRLDVGARGCYVIAALVTFQAELLLRGGMEIILALPLILFLLLRYLDAPRYDNSFFLSAGFVSSLCVLSRLDSVLLILPLFGLTFLRPKDLPAAFKSVVAFALGLTPVWGYLLLNKTVFGSFSPVSAQAKELRLHHTPQLEPLRSLVHPLTTVRLLVAVPGLLCAIVLIVLLFRRRGGFPAKGRPVLWALGLFPLLHLGALCVLSDWPLWYWYFYPLPLAGLGCMAALATWLRPSPRAWGVLAFGVTVISLGYTTAYNVSHPPRKNALFLAAQDVAAFADAHPGVYAMGDRSGTASYLTSSPMMQLEGLMMDEAYLQKLRAQPPLISVLRDYAVTYYISSAATLKDGCYEVVEPLQAGPDSAHMMGTFCQQPVATFLHDGVSTRIFRVAEAQRP